MTKVVVGPRANPIPVVDRFPRPGVHPAPSRSAGLFTFKASIQVLTVTVAQSQAPGGPRVAGGSPTCEDLFKHYSYRNTGEAVLTLPTRTRPGSGRRHRPCAVDEEATGGGRVGKQLPAEQIRARPTCTGGVTYTERGHIAEAGLV
jgi:hypothetical protein